MIRRQEGFTLVELMVTMVVFVLVIAAASQVFTGLLTQFKQQNKMAETHIEGAVGLNMLRRDLEHAGYGLPWVIPASVVSNPYSEAGVIDTPVATPWVDRDLNDGPPDNPVRGADAANTLHPPGAVRSLNNAYQVASFSASTCPGSGNCADVLSIKSVNVAMNNTSQAWTHLGFGNVKTNGLSGENFADTDRIVVLSPGTSDANRRALVTYTTGGTTTWFTTYGSTANFAPTNPGQTNIIYGIKPEGSPAVDPLIPFNRADYYIRKPSSGMPPACAPNTGILYKAVLRHDDNTAFTEYPLMSCVADLQVVYRVVDAAGDHWTDDTSLKTAAELRAQLREIRVYILAQEGQKDNTYTSPTPIYVGDSLIGFGRNYNLGTNTHYRWRLYNIVVQPSNLR